jgi:hypothetical protein
VPPAEDLEIRPGWRAGDAQLEADATAFWKRLGLLPAHVDPEARAKEIVLGAYREGRLVGVMTAIVGPLDFLRARFAFLRTAVDPEDRRGHAAATMAYHARALLERWSAEHPEEKLAGLGAALESRQLAEIAREPYWPGTRLMLARFLPDGRQVRVSWFSHYRVD